VLTAPRSGLLAIICDCIWSDANGFPTNAGCCACMELTGIPLKTKQARETAAARIHA
jgi:hypothetical protein